MKPPTLSLGGQTTMKLYTILACMDNRLVLTIEQFILKKCLNLSSEDRQISQFFIVK